MAKHTNRGMVEYAKAQVGRPYWYGTYGNIASPKLYKEKKNQYPKYYTANDFPSQYGQKVHDCSGLFKGYLMSPNADAPAVYNAKYDWSANGTIENCTEGGPISLIPDIPGLVVWKNNHVGCYIGNGWVIEAKGHKYGVVKTKLSATNWVRWGKHPAITYEICLDDFLDMLYVKVLAREPGVDNDTGKEYWLDAITTKKVDIDDCAREFFTCQEFVDRKTSDEEFVTLLYEVLFNRKPDADGFTFWVNKCKIRSRLGVVNGFLISPEWIAYRNIYLKEVNNDGVVEE